MGDSTARPQCAPPGDEPVPVLADPSLAFWKDTAKALMGESVKSMEETAKQIIAISGVLKGLYFHAITYANLRGHVSGPMFLLYIAPLAFWLVSLIFALLVFFPQVYTTNINSARASRAAFERIVVFKHGMLKSAGVALVVGSVGLAAALGAYLAG